MARTVLLAQSVGRASKVERLRLSLAPSERVLRMRWLTHVVGQSSRFEEAVLPLSRFPDLKPDDVVPHNFLELAREYGVKLGQAIEFASYLAGDDAVCSQLRVPRGTRLLRLDRVTHTRTGDPVEWRVIHAVADAD